MQGRHMNLLIQEMQGERAGKDAGSQKDYD